MMKNEDTSKTASSEKDGGIGSLVIGLQGITEFMSGVGSKPKRYDPLVYPDNQFEDVVDFTNQHLIGVQSLPISHLQSLKKLTFLPNIPVECRIIQAEPIQSYTDMDFLSSYLYTIRLKHGKFVWEVIRRYRQFHSLHKSLIKFVQSTMKQTISEVLAGANADTMNIPKLPLPNDLIAKLNADNIGNRSLSLEEYLRNVLRYPKFLNHEATKEFLEVSVMSFVDDLGPRFKEGLLKKRSMDDVKGKRFYMWIPFYFNCCKFTKDSKWFVVKDSYICYVRPQTQELSFPILFDHDFQFTSGFRHTAIQNGLKISNLQKKLFLKASSDREVQKWVKAIVAASKISESFIVSSRYNSFAPVRKSCKAKWFINGRNYMSMVANGIERAKEEIYITDWWLSPELYLKRPMRKGDKTYRLDHLLAKKANEGVRVYVLLYKEIKMALSINSYHSKRQLTIHNSSNIKVIRHSNHDARTFMWSHHEKSVIIDQKIAFVGGIDLCFGRWDDETYRLTDQYPEQKKMATMSTPPSKPAAGEGGLVEAYRYINPGQSIAMTMLAPMTVVHPPLNSSHQQRHAKSNINQNRQRLIVDEKRGEKSAQLNKDGSVVTGQTQLLGRPPSKHERVVQKWQALKEAVQVKSQSDGGGAGDDDESEEEKEFEKDEELIRAAEIEYDKKGGAQDVLWPGKDYSNSYVKDFLEVNKFYEDSVDRNVQWRMPWHDEASVVLGEAAQDVARHFIQRWNDAKRSKHLTNPSYPYLLPKAYLQDLPDDSWFSDLHDVDVQVLRSVCSWSAGISIIESSILTAYCDMIKSSKHFILMENQFFITSTSRSDPVKNGIGSAIFDRIMRAHWNNEQFRMYVILPLLPGFDAQRAIQAIQHFTMRSIVSGENCLYNKLKNEGGIQDPSKYIQFFGMRTYDSLNEVPCCEIIYVHSKLMIVDDCRAIVGSANINDRSLLGFRDSELALLIEDRTLIPGRMNGIPTKVGPFCSSWRRTIFEHLLGLKSPTRSSKFINIDISDPCTDEFFEQMMNIARKNSEIYDQVFNVFPNNHVRNNEQLHEYRQRPILATTNKEEALRLLKENIQGYIVELPLYFLYDVDYYPQAKTKEGLAPYIMWT